MIQVGDSVQNYGGSSVSTTVGPSLLVVKIDRYMGIVFLRPAKEKWYLRLVSKQAGNFFSRIAREVLLQDGRIPE